MSDSTSNSRPWAAAQTGFKGGLSTPPLRIPGSFLLRAVAGTMDLLWHIGVWRKMSSLRDPRISGFEPTVLNHSFGAIFERAMLVF